MRKLFITALFGLLVASCSSNRNVPAGPECNVDSDCLEQSKPYCHQEVCVECFSGDQCEGHEVCSEQACAPLGATMAPSSGYEANAHGIWEGVAGEDSYTFVKTCSSDQDCTIGQLCNPLTKGCVDAASYQVACSVITDVCPSGQACATSISNPVCLPTALCQTQSNCYGDPDLICGATDGSTGLCIPDQNECTPPATLTSTCPLLPRELGGDCNGENCCSAPAFCSHFGACVECVCDADCAPDGSGNNTKCYLADNTCRPADYCVDSTECADGQSCDTENKKCSATCTPETVSQVCSDVEFCNTVFGVCRPLTELPCAADDWEPNDTKEEASSANIALSLPALGASQTLSGFSSCGGDEDWYQLDLDAGDRLTITGTGIGEMEGSLTAFGPDGITALAPDGFFGAFPSLLDFTANSDAIHYLRVRPSAGKEGLYNLTIARSAAAACSDSAEDSVSNNTAASATSLYDHSSPAAVDPCALSTAGGTSTVTCDGGVLNLCPGDVDYYLISVEAGSAIEFRVDNFAGNLDLDLYGPFAEAADVNTQTLLAQSASTATAEVVSTTARSAAFYLAKVYAAGGTTAAYDFQVQITAASPACTEDPYDDPAAVGAGNPTSTLVVDPSGYNDTNSAATQVALTDGGSVTLHDSPLTLCRGDVDWFELGRNDTGSFALLEASHRVEVTLSLDSSSASGDIQLAGGTDPSALETASFDVVTSEYKLTIPLTDGTSKYLLRVQEGPQNTSKLDYNLNIALVSAPTCGEDGLGDTAVSNNNAPADATLLSVTDSSQLRENISLCPGDDDWYQVTPSGQYAGYQLLVETEHDPSIADLELVLYNSSVSAIANPTAGTLPGAGVLDSSSESGRGYQQVRGFDGGNNYFVVVTNRTGWPLPSYSLKLTFVPNACTEDAFEENDTYDQPTTLSLVPTAHNGQLHSGVLNPMGICSSQGGEEDFYAVGLERGDQITARVYYNPSEGGLNLKLHAPGAAGQNGVLDSDTDSATGGSTGVLEVNYTTLSTDESGDYLLRVTPDSNPSNYYALEALVTRACVDDSLEPSPPQELGTLPKVFSSEPHDMTLCYDSDWLKLVLADTDVVTVCTQYDLNKIDLLLEAHDTLADSEESPHPEGTNISASSYDRDGDQRIVLQNTTGGDETYYLRIYPSFTPMPDPFVPPFPYNEDYELWLLSGDVACPPNP